MDLIIRSRYGELAEMVASQLRQQRLVTAISVDVRDDLTRYALLVPPDMPAQDIDALRDAIAPMQPKTHALPTPGQSPELLLGDSSPLGKYSVTARGADYCLLKQITERLELLRFRREEWSVVPTDDSRLGYGCAPPIVRDIILWCAAQHGVHLPLSHSGGLGHDLLLHVRSPEGTGVAPRSSLPVVLRGDDPVVLDRMRATLIEAGFSNAVVSTEPWDGVADRLVLHPGPFQREELAADLLSLRTIASQIVETSGVDVRRFPVQVDKGVWTKRTTFDLPVTAARTGALATYAGPFPERIDAIVHADDPVQGEILAEGLRACGFRGVHVLKLDDPKGFSIRWGAMKSPVVQHAVRALVRAGMANAPSPHQLYESGGATEPADSGDGVLRFDEAMETLEDEDEDDEVAEDGSVVAEPLRIELPVQSASSGLLLTLGAQQARDFDARIFVAGKVTRRVQVLQEALGKCFRSVNVVPGDAGRSIQYGGAPAGLLDHVRAVVLEACEVDLPARKIWDDEDHDVYVRLPRMDEPPGESPPWFLSAAPALRCVDHAFFHIRKESVRIGPLVLPRRREPTDLPILPTRCFAHHCVDGGMAATFLHVAESVLLGEPCLLEGEPGTSKTSAVMMLASALRQPVFRVNLHGQTDASELVGRYAPASGTSGLGWAWVEGVVPMAMTKGAWLLIDEVNLAEPQNLERLNSVLEIPPTLLLAEHDNEWIGPGGVQVHPDFRVFGTMNPSTEAGRSLLSRAWMDRWLGHRFVAPPSEADLVSMFRYLLFGEAPAVILDGVSYSHGRTKPIHQRARQLDRIDLFVERAVRFHVSLNQAFRKGEEGEEDTLGAWGRDTKVFTRRSLLRLAGFLDRMAHRSNVAATYRDGIDRYYMRKLASPQEQKLAALMLDASGLAELLGGGER